MVLITGGNGAIGGRLAGNLLRRGHRVRVLGLPQVQTDSELRKLGVEVLHGDVTQANDLGVAMIGVKTVFHLAAILSSPENPHRFQTVNVGGTRLALAAAQSAKVHHFILVSSISVIYPRRNAYSTSKAEAERLVQLSAVPTWTLVRPCLVLDGAGGGAEYRAFTEGARKFAVLPLPRAGAALKRPIHVDDLAEALARMVGNPACSGKTYALGGADIVSLRQMSQRRIVAIPEWPFRWAASLLEWLSHQRRRRVSWLCHQSVDGLVYDAAPDIQLGCDDLGFTPRGFLQFSQDSDP